MRGGIRAALTYLGLGIRNLTSATITSGFPSFGVKWFTWQSKQSYLASIPITLYLCIHRERQRSSHTWHTPGQMHTYIPPPRQDDIIYTYHRPFKDPIAKSGLAFLEDPASSGSLQVALERSLGTCTQSCFSTAQLKKSSKTSFPYLAKQAVEHVPSPLHLYMIDGRAHIWGDISTQASKEGRKDIY